MPVCHSHHNLVWSYLDSKELVQGNSLACQVSRVVAVFLMAFSKSLRMPSAWLVKCLMAQCHKVVPMLTREALLPLTKLWLKCKRLSVEVDLVVVDKCKECKVCRAIHSKCLGLLKVCAAVMVDLNSLHNLAVAGWA